MLELYTRKEIHSCPYANKKFNKLIPLHTHTFWEFAFSHENTTTHYINGVEIECPKMNKIILMKPGDTHALHKKDYYLHYDIYVEDSKMRNICNLIDKDLYTLLTTSSRPLVFEGRYKDLELIEQTLDHIINHNSNASKQDSLESLHTTVICQILGLYYKNKLTNNNHYPDWINDFFNKLKTEEFLCKNLKEILNDMYYTRGYMCHTFKKYVGKTMGQCLCEAKIEYSTHLLADESMSILDIAMHLNYSSQCAYISSFKKIYSITPNVYRKTVLSNLL